MAAGEHHTKDLTVTALFTAVLSVLAVFQIPMPSGVPVTLQTFAVALSGYVLGKKYGFWATALYLLIGTAGLPVFTGMQGGPGVLLGPTGGFLFGFLGLAFLAGLGSEQEKKSGYWGLGIAGLLLCHMLGALQFSLVSGRTFREAVLLVSLPYMLKDLLSVLGAGAAAAAIRRALRRAGLSG